MIDSPLAYIDCRALWDRALEATKGIRVPVGAHGQAVQLRLRLNRYRAIDRRENAKTYEPGHPLFGRSVYDAFAVRLHDDTTVEIVPLSLQHLDIEEIT